MGHRPLTAHTASGMQQGLIQLSPLSYQDFYSLPAGFEYSNRISEASKRTSFTNGLKKRDLTRCIVCGLAGEGFTHRMYVIRDRNLVSNRLPTLTKQYF